MADHAYIQSNGAPKDRLRQEYQRQTALFDLQPPIVQRFLEAQARQIAEAYLQRPRTARFSLPDRIVTARNSEPAPIPQEVREQRVGSFRDRLANLDVHDTIRNRLAKLEQSDNEAVGISAGLLRYAAANHMVRNLLPSGRRVTYAAAEDGDIPSIPVKSEMEPESAIMAPSDAVTEQAEAEAGRGSLQVPYVPAARRFYLPQWVAFDDQGGLLIKSKEEAEAHVASMQRFLNVLFAARSLAPYMVTDEEFEKKRYGMLGQLVNQGRALAYYQTGEIIKAIQERVAAQSLNRGLSLRLPYFDDQDLRIESHDFVVIPAGRIMFVPAFVVRACLEEQAKVEQDTRFSASTRKHLLNELQILGDAFKSSGT